MLDPERRQDIDTKLDWPEEGERKIADRDAAAQDASARRSAAGIGVRNIDRMLENAWLERQRILAEVEAAKAAPGTEGGS